MSYARPQMHRKDGNESPLVELFVKLGGLWLPYANKPFDGWAYHNHFGYLPVEIKLPERKNRANRYTRRQKKVIELLAIKQAPRLEWETEEDVYQSCGARRTA